MWQTCLVQVLIHHRDHRLIVLGSLLRCWTRGQMLARWSVARWNGTRLTVAAVNCRAMKCRRTGTEFIVEGDWEKSGEEATPHRNLFFYSGWETGLDATGRPLNKYQPKLEHSIWFLRQQLRGIHPASLYSLYTTCMHCLTYLALYAKGTKLLCTQPHFWKIM